MIKHHRMVYLNNEMIRPLIVLICFICLPFILSAQEKEWVQKGHYTVEQGLPSNRVYSVAEDLRGFLWAATDNGLSCFDGYRFRNYNMLDGLSDNEVIQVLVENDGTVWANIFPRGLFYLDTVHDMFIAPPGMDSLLGADGVNTMRLTKCPGGGIIYHGNSSKLKKVRYEIKRRLIIGRAYGHKMKSSRLLDAVLFDNDSLTGNKTKSVFNLYCKGLLIDSVIVRILSSQIGSVNVEVLYDSLFTYFRRGHRLFRLTAPSSHTSIIYKKSVTIDPAISHAGLIYGNYLIYTSRKSIYIYDKYSLQQLFTVSLPFVINYAFMDKGENLWVSTDESGLIKLRRSEVIGTFSNNEKNRNTTAIYKDKRGDLILGTSAGEVYQYSNGFCYQRIKTPVTDSYVRKIFEVGNRIVSLLDAGVWVNWRYMAWRDGQMMSIKDACQYNDSILFICGQSIFPLKKLNLNNQRIEHCNVGPLKRIEHLLLVDSNTLYFTNNMKLFCYKIRENRYNQVNLPSQKDIRITSMMTDSIGRVWLALADQRVLVVKNGQTVTVLGPQEGVSAPVTCMLALHSGQILFGTRNGLLLFKPAEVQARVSRLVTRYTTDDGLVSNQVNTLIRVDDSLYIGTNKGICVLPAELDRQIPLLQSYLVECQIDGRKFPLQRSYQLPKGKKHISLDFMSPALNGGLNYFEYSLDKGSNWKNIYGSRIDLLLENGEYAVWARAVNNDLSVGPISVIRFSIHIPFYERYLFWTLISVLASGIFFIGLNQRKQRRQREFYERSNLLATQRNQLTADLHDDIGSSLSSLQINSALARQLLDKNKPEAAEAIHKVEKQSKALYDKISDFIWSLKPVQEEFMSLTTRIRTYASDILAAKEINYTFELHEEVNDDLSDPMIRKNVIMIAKEAINNAAKYSGAKQVNIRLTNKGGAVILSIRDNGSGFDPAATNGNGVGNMKKRATEIGGELVILSSEREGTEIRLSLNLTTRPDRFKQYI